MSVVAISREIGISRKAVTDAMHRAIRTESLFPSSLTQEEVGRLRVLQAAILANSRQKALSVQATIEDYTSESNPSEAQKGHVFTKRDSKSNIKSWKKKLTEAEIAHIRNKVEDISSKFYTDADW